MSTTNTEDAMRRGPPHTYNDGYRDGWHDALSAARALVDAIPYPDYPDGPTGFLRVTDVLELLSGQSETPE